MDSMIFGKMVGCPWWTGLIMAGFSLLPKLEATKAVMASDNKLRVSWERRFTKDMSGNV